MDIAPVVLSAVRLYLDGMTEPGMLMLAPAIDFTARLEAGARRSKAEHYKAFLQRHMVLITAVSFGGVSIRRLNLRVPHPNLKHASNGLASLPDILYHVVRCSLIHEAKLSDSVEFIDEPAFDCNAQPVRLPKALFVGMLVAVVSSPCFVDLSSASGHVIWIREDFGLPLDHLWGRRDELCREIQQRIGPKDFGY